MPTPTRHAGTASQMQNVRAVGIRAEILFKPPRRPGMRPMATPAAMTTLGALHFLGIRTAAIGRAEDLLAAGLSPAFEEILPENSPPSMLSRAFGLAPADILHVGGSLEMDVNAALAAGMRAGWLAPAATFHPRGAATLLRKLTDLPDILRLADTARHHAPPGSRHARNLIALLRGCPPNALEIEGRHAIPASDASALMFDIATRLRVEAAPIEVLRRCWHELVPQPLLNAGSAPERLTPAGTLNVHCQNTVVREELRRWHDRNLRLRIPMLPGCSHIKKIAYHI
ncbi:MAG: hypothetical protein LBG65_01240 [Puniceicoccales bacterium]|jgi:hypothetical protein|nr:hypothetical protein [Puniceicoccales bacterium]